MKHTVLQRLISEKEHAQAKKIAESVIWVAHENHRRSESDEAEANDEALPIITWCSMGSGNTHSGCSEGGPGRQDREGPDVRMDIAAEVVVQLTPVNPVHLSSCGPVCAHITMYDEPDPHYHMMS